MIYSKKFHAFMEASEKPVSMSAKIPIEKEIYILMDALRQGDSSVEVYVVGGVVRDYLLHHYHGFEFDPNDYDIACNLPGDEINRKLKTPYARKLGITFQNKQNQDTFGVVFVTVGGKNYEVAPFRIDVGSADGRRPEDTMAGTIQQDADRRDLTINSLYYDVGNQRILDFNGGIEDIKNKVVKSVGDPHKRMAEDRLRVLRAARYAATIGGTLDPATAAAAKAHNPLRNSQGHLLPISHERIDDEFIKGLKKAQDVSAYLRSMNDLGLLEVVFPQMHLDIQGIDRLRGVTSTKVALAWLLRGNGEDTEAQLSALKMGFTGNFIKPVQFLINCLDFRPEKVYDLTRKRRNFPGIEQDMLELARVANNPQLAHFARYQPVYPDGGQLMKQGFEGPDIGLQQQQHAANHYSQTYPAFVPPKDDV